MENLEFERYFFEIPFYRCTPGEFYAERDRVKQEHIDFITQTCDPEILKQDKGFYARIDGIFAQQFGSWRYGQVAGWLRLYVLGRQIRGEIWVVDARRVQRKMNNKKFHLDGKAFELDLPSDESSSTDIYNQVRLAIQKLESEKPVKGRYLDLEAFHNIGQFINWRELAGLE